MGPTVSASAVVMAGGAGPIKEKGPPSPPPPELLREGLAHICWRDPRAAGGRAAVYVGLAQLALLRGSEDPPQAPSCY